MHASSFDVSSVMGSQRRRPLSPGIAARPLTSVVDKARTRMARMARMATGEAARTGTEGGGGTLGPTSSYS